MNPTATLTCRHADGDLAVASVTGELTYETMSVVRAQALDLIQRGHRHLILDLHQITFCDSSGFSTLVGIWRYAQQAQGTVVLAAVPDRLSRMLALTGLDELLLAYPTTEEALAAHRSP
ncbi:hypothetical protein CFC35_40250 [Streptomyces sp. FBKL.4005]|uniref:STAS domain-containing protein n=1 Tax=unclassified Streptomyces TaxID=2593676 RepID=UPI000B9770BC|nr:MULTISPECIES: STAS domain-containing protein [unclassified Streptomyces]MCE0444805.1 STAS domain-containing protein [Streptomyces tricolor]OYP10447.1 hypothetical protein CFC35_40250 [Streptomyces sp. FBKL.4005]BCM72952.1 putative anti-sigma factor antagonist [Streptomyces sp. EAS-AB2608]